MIVVFFFFLNHRRSDQAPLCFLAVFHRFLVGIEIIQIGEERSGGRRGVEGKFWIEKKETRSVCSSDSVTDD